MIVCVFKKWVIAPDSGEGAAFSEHLDAPPPPILGGYLRKVILGCVEYVTFDCSV